MHSDIFGMTLKLTLIPSLKTKRKHVFLFVFSPLLLLLLLLLSLELQCVQAVKPATATGGTSPSVQYYEPVFYDPLELVSQHRRAKREVGHSNHNNNNNKESFKFNLQSQERNFRMNLDIDKTVFHSDVVIENSDGPLDYDTSRVLTGYLEDEPDSLAHGILTSNGFFDGFISTNAGNEYYIEPSHKYSSLSNNSQGVMYRPEDVNWPTESETPTCASHELHLKRKEENLLFKNEREEKNGSGENFPDQIIVKKSLSRHQRKKRWAIDPKKKTCMLFLQADHLFYKHFGSEEASIDVMTRHIQRVNEIYRSTDFDSDGKPDEISFMIKRVKVHTSNHTLDPAYRYQGEFQVIRFLELFSEGDYDSFCLAYMFTFRDFEGGTLGLAWTGDLKNAGGVCERKGHFRGGLKSLNTGIITLLNYGKFVLPPVSHVTLAHEIGHNFGSPHDPEADKMCTPGGKEGNYIMFARATAGDQRNNNRFSPCSLKSINPVLNFKAKDIHGCFAEPQGAICGNREVEDGEQCDCGWEEDCNEPCCFPMKIRPGKHEPPCQLRPLKDCSPSQGPCCYGNCTLKLGDKCRDDNGCRDTAFCDGYMPMCPKSRHKPNKTVCNEEAVCFMGECTGSICLAYGLEVCQCNAEVWESASKLCELCCKLPGEGNPCLSSFQWNHAPLDVPDLYSKPGSPCKNYTGYCDPYHSCREVDPSGPLSTLRNLLLADEGLAAIATWIDNHWYAVLSFVALLIVTMILTAKFCGKKAKARLRKITVMHSNVEAIQIQRSYLDEQGEHVIHPLAVRKKIPFKKKVRERRGKSRKTKHGDRKVGNSSNSPNNKSSNENNGSGSLWRRKREERSKIKKTDAVQNQGVEPMVGTSAALAVASLSTDPVAGSSHLNSNTAFALATTCTPQNQISSDCHDYSHGPATAANLSNNCNGVVVHESKTAIVPNANAKRQKRRGRKSNEKSRDGNHPSNGRKKPGTSSTQKREKETKSRDSSSKKSPGTTTTTPTDGSKSSTASSDTRKNIQVIYKPPFSLKVQVIPSDKNGNNANTNKEVPKPKGSSRTNGVSKPSVSASPSAPLQPKSSGSFLQRRKGNLKSKSKNNSELRVLIPATQEDEDLSSPITPIS